MSNNNYMGKIDKDRNPKGINYFHESVTFPTKGNYDTPTHKNNYKCNKCNGTFDDKQKDSEDDDRCPLCKIAFSQMPYEAPHEISDFSIVKKHEHDGGDDAGKVDCLKCEKQMLKHLKKPVSEDTGTFADHLEEIDRD